MKLAHEERLAVAGAAGDLEVVVNTPASTRGVALIAHPHPLYGGTLDNKVVHALMSGDKATLCALPRDRLNRGPGTPEILNWVTVSAAMAPTKMDLIDYLPCYRSVASTGHGVAFASWTPKK